MMPPPLSRLRALYRRLRRGRPAAPAPPQGPPPLAPDGWRVVARSGDVTTFEVARLVGPGEGATGPFPDFCGANAAEFRGFAPGTLLIAGVGVESYRDASGPVLRLTYRFDHRAKGFNDQPGCAKVPPCDFTRLPWGCD